MKSQEENDWLKQLDDIGIKNIIKKQLEDDPDCGKAVDNSTIPMKTNNLACG